MKQGGWIFRSADAAAVWPAMLRDEQAGVVSLLAQLEQSQWLPPERLREGQARQLDWLLRHAWSAAPYYAAAWRGAFDPAQPFSWEAFRALPLLRRSHLQEHFADLKARDYPRGHGRTAEARSSGSTGMPVRFLTSSLTGLLWRVITLRDHLWHGRDLSADLAVIRITSKKEPSAAASWGGATRGLLATGRMLGLSITTEIEEQLEWLVRHDPAYLLTYPSNLGALARLARERGVRPGKLREARTLGEVLEPAVRAVVREAWGVPVTDVYSSQEVGYLALQCPQAEHYHVQSEMLLVEVLDEAGRECRPGEIGRVVVTALHNAVMPLVRYDIGDYAEVGAPCACGRGLPVLARVAGRSRNMLVTPGGGRT